jgi:hypothetical protein
VLGNCAGGAASGSCLRGDLVGGNEWDEVCYWMMGACHSHEEGPESLFSVYSFFQHHVSLSHGNIVKMCFGDWEERLGIGC